LRKNKKRFPQGKALLEEENGCNRSKGRKSVNTVADQKRGRGNNREKKIGIIGNPPDFRDQSQEGNETNCGKVGKRENRVEPDENKKKKHRLVRLGRTNEQKEDRTGPGLFGEKEK